MIKLTLKDGNVKEIENPMSILDIAKLISEGLARMATCRRSRWRSKGFKICN